MNHFGSAFSQNFSSLRSFLKKSFVLNSNNLRHYCEYPAKVTEYPARVTTEKSINHVTLLGRVGINPQLRGSEAKPVAVFSLATNINYRYDSGEFQQKTEWHRISVFKQSLREVVLEHLKKGSRIYLEGRLAYGEFADAKGVVHNTTTIVANEIIFLGSGKKNEVDYDDDEEEASL